MIDGLERRADIEHAAAAGTQHVPRQFEQAEPGGVQERGQRALFVEAVLGGEIEHIDAAEVAIGRFTNRLLDGGNAIGIGRLPQHAEKSFRFTHRSWSLIPGSVPRRTRKVGLRSLPFKAQGRERMRIATSQRIDVCLEILGKRL